MIMAVIDDEIRTLSECKKILINVANLGALRMPS